MRTMFAATVFALTIGCSEPLRRVRSQSPSGQVGRVPLTVVAQLVSRKDFGWEGSGGHPGVRRETPFLVAVTPTLEMSGEPERGPVICVWNDDAVVIAFASDILGLRGRPLLMGNDRRIEQLWQFDAALRPTSATLDDLRGTESKPSLFVFYVAHLCSEGERTVLVIHYGDPRHLWGHGFNVRLRRSAGEWSVEGVEPTWES